MKLVLTQMNHRQRSKITMKAIKVLSELAIYSTTDCRLHLTPVMCHLAHSNVPSVGR